jgi:hypothetical protein
MKTPSALFLSLLGWVSLGAVYVLLITTTFPTFDLAARLLTVLAFTLMLVGATTGAVGLWHKRSIVTNLIALLMLIPTGVLLFVLTRPLD